MERVPVGADPVGVRLREHHGKYILDIIFAGRRWRESTGVSIPVDKQLKKEALALAETIRTKKELSLIARKNGIQDPTADRMLLLDYLQESARGKSKKYSIHKVIEWIKKLAPNTRFSDLSPRWLENFQNTLVSTSGLSLQTCEHYCNALRHQFKLAVRDKVLFEDPGAGVPHIKVLEQRRPHLETWEIEQLMKTPIKGQKSGIGPAIKQAWLFAVATGLRISDIRTLRWEHIDLKTKQVSKTQEKTGRLVIIPIKDEALKLIDDGIEHERADFVFPRIAELKTIENTNTYLREWGKAAGLTKPIGWHIARHTDATQLLEAGADIYTVKELLGHTKIETTMKYARVTNKKRKAAVDALPEYGFGEEESEGE